MVLTFRNTEGQSTWGKYSVIFPTYATFTGYTSTTTNGAYTLISYTQTPPSNAITINGNITLYVLLVGGGGEGGFDNGGGGGGGGVLQNVFSNLSYPDTVNITVGAGGTSTALNMQTNGGTSQFTFNGTNSTSSINAYGGGAGGSYGKPPLSGSSGGGAGPNGTNVTGAVAAYSGSQGKSGGNANNNSSGGGGGSGTAGTSGNTGQPGNGGTGTQTNTAILTGFSGSTYATYYWGGGGGGCTHAGNSAAGSGGKGGGGGGSSDNGGLGVGSGDTGNALNNGVAGLTNSLAPGGPGGMNTGGGAGAASQSILIGSPGGSGICVVAALTSQISLGAPFSVTSATQAPDLIWFKMDNTTLSSATLSYSTLGNNVSQFFNYAVGNSVGNGTLWYNASSQSGNNVAAATTNTNSLVTTNYFSLPSVPGRGYTVCFWYYNTANSNGSPFELFVNGSGTVNSNACSYTNTTAGNNISITGTSGSQSSTVAGNSTSLYLCSSGTTSASSTFTSSFAASTWYHIAFTNLCTTNNSATGGTYSIFLNGTKVGASYTGSYYSGNANNMVGLWSSYVGSTLADFRLYGSVVPASTINSIYAQSLHS